MPKRFFKEVSQLPSPDELSPPPIGRSVPKKPAHMDAIDEIKQVIQEPVPKPVVKEGPVQERFQYPPIFVKIEKYKEIIDMLHSLRSESVGLRDTLEALAEMEAEMRRALDMANRAVDSFNQTLSALSSKFMKTGSEQESIKPPSDIDMYVNDIQKQIERIKDELKGIPLK